MWKKYMRKRSRRRVERLSMFRKTCREFGRLLGHPAAAIVLAILQIVFSVAAVSGDSYSEAIDATVRIRHNMYGGKSEVGTGCIFYHETQTDTYYALTNAHVAGRVGSLREVEFWSDGYKSNPVRGYTVASWYSESPTFDIAITAIKWGNLPDSTRPNVMRIAPPDYRISTGDVICTVGCPGGEWPTCWKGHINDAVGHGDGTFLFTPTPQGGRSGSAIFDVEANMIVGLIAWKDGYYDAYRTFIPVQGKAQRIETIYAAFSTSRQATDIVMRADHAAQVKERKLVDIPSQCGPDGCQIYPGQGQGQFVHPYEYYFPSPSPGPSPGQQYDPYQQQMPPEWRQQQPPQQQRPPGKDWSQYDPWQGGTPPSNDGGESAETPRPPNAEFSAQIDERFEEYEKRLNEHGGRIDTLEKINARVEVLEEKIETPPDLSHYEKRIQQTEETVSNISEQTETFVTSEFVTESVSKVASRVINVTPYAGLAAGGPVGIGLAIGLTALAYLRKRRSEPGVSGSQQSFRG